MTNATAVTLILVGIVTGFAVAVAIWAFVDPAWINAALGPVCEL